MHTLYMERCNNKDYRICSFIKEKIKIITTIIKFVVDFIRRLVESGFIRSKIQQVDLPIKFIYQSLSEEDIVAHIEMYKNYGERYFKLGNYLLLSDSDKDIINNRIAQPQNCSNEEDIFYDCRDEINEFIISFFKNNCTDGTQFENLSLEWQQIIFADSNEVLYKLYNENLKEYFESKWHMDLPLDLKIKVLKVFLQCTNLKYNYDLTYKAVVNKKVDLIEQINRLIKLKEQVYKVHL